MTTNTERELIDADEVAAIAENISAASHGFPPEYQGKLRTWAKRLRALLSQPRTLADMTPEEREACQWSLVETPENEGVFIKQHGNKALVIYPNGRHIFWDLNEVVPMLDLPRMVWPDEHRPATDEGGTPEAEDGIYGEQLWEMVTKSIRDEKEYSIDAQDYDGVKRWRDAERALGAARGINPPTEPSTQPRPEDVPEGEPWIVECYGDRHVGTRDPQESPHWALARMDGTDVTFAGDHQVTLVSRLVPEKEQA